MTIGIRNITVPAIMSMINRFLLEDSLQAISSSDGTYSDLSFSSSRERWYSISPHSGKHQNPQGILLPEARKFHRILCISNNAYSHSPISFNKS